jgi:Peptidase_C39 like family
MIRHALVLVAAVVLVLTAAAQALAGQNYPINFKNFPLTDSHAQLSGTVLDGSSLKLAPTGLSGPVSYTDLHADYNSDGVDGSGMYMYGTWTSDVSTLEFPFNELVASWNADTPPGTWVQVEVTPRIGADHWAKWYILGQWSYGDSDFHRTSVGGQGDADGFVAIDTFFAKDHLATAYQLRLTLFRRIDSIETPTVTRLSAVASNLTNQKGSFPSSPTGLNRDLNVPQFSQEIHHGEYPEFDNGGEAWCSPTSTSMVVDYWDRLFPGNGYAPSAAETAWVGFPDPWVDFTARYVYDYHYNGAGNWPFNTAYAAGRGLVADVTQLHNLREAEPFIQAGVPLVASVAWESNKLDGGIKSTNGHLAVIAGFTDDGKKVIVNDPASDTNDLVKHEYDREQFEKAWIPASGGIVYVIRPAGFLPESMLTANNT